MQTSTQGREEGQYSIVLPFRVTPDQRQELRRLAAQRGVSVSALIRSCVLPNTTSAQRDGATLPAK